MTPPPARAELLEWGQGERGMTEAPRPNIRSSERVLLTGSETTTGRFAVSPCGGLGGAGG